jgi:hypothetical protein
VPQRKSRGSPAGAEKFDLINNKCICLIKQNMGMYSHGKYLNNIKEYIK